MEGNNGAEKELAEIKTTLKLILDECERSHSQEHSHWLCKKAFPEVINPILNKE